MKNRIRKRFFIPFVLLALLSILNSPFSTVRAVGTSFTYQGLMELENGGSPVTGLYDFNFILFSNAIGGNVAAGPLPINAVGVTNGLFMATLNFGPVFDGKPYWLEIASRRTGSGAGFQTAGRVELTPVPYAIFAEKVADNSVTGSKIAVPLNLSGSITGGATITGQNNAPLGSGSSGVVGNGYDIGVTGAGVRYGVYGYSTLDFGDGVYGTGVNGVHGVASDPDYTGVRGESSGNGIGVSGTSITGVGVSGSSSSGEGVFGTGSNGVHGVSSNLSGNAVLGENTGDGIGVHGSSYSGPGVQGDSSDNAGVYGSSSDYVGVYGTSSYGNGVYGRTYSGGNGGQAGVHGESFALNGTAVFGEGRNTGCAGVAGVADVQGGTGVYGRGSVWAGYFDGKVSVCSLTTRGGCDVAEPFQMSGPEIPKGAVVVIDDQNPGQLKLSQRAYDKRVAGVVSGANGIASGISLSQEGVIEGGQNVALSGRVYVQADASNGAIKPGDLLTSSSAPGYAMKVSDYRKAKGAVIGKAMSGLKNGRGMVLVLVSLQ
ncbi:MAG: hypothetical protein C5B50_12330 [Verrucomicrobia bacterium]|nr:MAG: hypothetical protein C5B50_12330 [Verrucomicrobiota bacterium]